MRPSNALSIRSHEWQEDMTTQRSRPRLSRSILALALAGVMATGAFAPFAALGVSANPPGILLGELRYPAGSLASAEFGCGSHIAAVAIGPGYLVDDADTEAPGGIMRYARAELESAATSTCDISPKSHRFGIGFRIY
jgi:hypothetical protein